MNIDISDTILIVTGSELVPEEKDRPLAYRLKAAMDPKSRSEYQRAIVVSDLWYMENEIFQICATLLVGGPGVNTATAHFYQKLPMVWNFENLSFMQMADSGYIKIALWGMNQESTEMAVNYFIEDHLFNFLSSIWKIEEISE